MTKLNNKGFSLVEIIIAAAVFAILIYPITNAIMTSAKTETTSTKKQYAVEKAEEVMEIFKNADLSASGVDVPDDDGSAIYTLAKGTSTSYEVGVPTDASADKATYTVTTYTGKMSLGTSYETYDCTVEVSDAGYQVMKKGYVLTEIDENGKAVCKTASDGSGYVKTSATSSGTIRNLDSDQSAIIIGATYSATASEHNLDNLAYQYFKDVKTELISDDEIRYSQLLSGADLFGGDSFTKNTTITITKDSVTSTYTVTCEVEYTDTTAVAVIANEYETSGKNKYKPSTVNGDGVVYKQEFKDELPPIYLLYVPATSNGKYCSTDYITVDNSDVMDEEVKVYLFETTADELSDEYKSVIEEQFGVTDVDNLTFAGNSNIKASDVVVKVQLASAVHDKISGGVSNDNLKIYANFKTNDTSPDYMVLDTTEDESDSIYMYDITVTLTDSKGNKTTVSGTRGK